MKLLLLACVFMFSLAFYIILYRKAYGITTALVILGLVSIVYGLLTSMMFPPLPVTVLKEQAGSLDGIELTARAEVSLGNLSPSSLGAKLIEPDTAGRGEEISVFAGSLAGANYLFPKNKSAYMPGDKVWIKYVPTSGVLYIKEAKPPQRPGMVGTGGVILLMVGLLQAFKKRKPT